MIIKMAGTQEDQDEMALGEHDICGPLLNPTDQVAIEGDLLDVPQSVEEDADDDQVLEDKLDHEAGAPAREEDALLLQ